MYNVGRINNGLLPTGGNGRVWAPGLEHRMERQNGRVAEGIANGSLSQSELQDVRGSERAYRQELRADKASGGYVSFQERRELHQELNGISQQIHDYKHN